MYYVQVDVYTEDAEFNVPAKVRTVKLHPSIKSLTA